MEHWLTQGIISNAVYGLLLAGIGVAFAYLKARRWKWAEAAMYGLVAAAAASVLAAAFGLPSFLSGGPAPENVESYVRRWSNHFSWGVQPQNQTGNRFTLRLIFPNGRSVNVWQEESSPEYLRLIATIRLDGDSLDMYQRFTPTQREALLEEVRLDMSRAGLATFFFPDTPAVGVVHTLPITKELAEHHFLSAMDAVLVGQTLARDALVMSVRRRAPPAPND